MVHRSRLKSNSTIDNNAISKTSKSSNSSKPQVKDPYDGWKSATLQYERIDYKYPSDWKITDDSAASPKSAGGCTYPGHDLVTISSPSGTQVSINAGQDCFGDAETKAFGYLPIKSLGQNLYLVFEGSSGPIDAPTGPDSACIAQTTNPGSNFDLKSKNIFYNGEGSGSEPVNSFCYLPYDPKTVTAAPPASTVSQIKATKDFNTAKLILESMHY
ncbi:MAG: hypothetical protein ACXWLH_06550 [Candidatus Saccharimonadales bacterium]